MSTYILSLDQGTTGSTALLVDDNGNVMAKHTIEFPQHFPQPGWVEHNLGDIWQSTQGAIQKILTNTKINPVHIKAIGITNQRETIGLWQGPKAIPLHHAIVWQCRRTAQACEALAPHAEMIFHKTGLMLDPYFSASKIQWLLEHLQLTSLDQVYCGTMDSFLIFKLTQGQNHVTDVSNASRTMLMDLATLAWDASLLQLFNIPEQILPKICDSSGIVGYTRGLDVLPDGIPIAGIAGDQQAALFGQTCFEKSQGKCTYGTGAFLLVNTGKDIVHSEHRLLTTVAWKIGPNVQYALEGSVFMAGAAVQWLRDGLQIIKSSQDIEALAVTVSDTLGVTFVPALTGLGAPHWSPHARGMFLGLTRGTTKAHLARATLEAIAQQVTDVLVCMEEDMGHPLKNLKVDGGASMNHLLMQMQADFSGRSISRSTQTETTALGAAYLAGLSVGIWKDPHIFKNLATRPQL
ncbi:MAG: glycerol kinase GlpK [Bdellovibrionota bacterium]